MKEITWIVPILCDFLLILACEKSVLCDDNLAECGPVLKKPQDQSCHRNFWHLEIHTFDNHTGIQDILVTSPGSEIIETAELMSRAIGSSRTFKVIVRVDCCYKGVELTVVDLAANKAKCVAGINPNLSHYFKSNSCLLFNLQLLFGVLNKFLLKI